MKIVVFNNKHQLDIPHEVIYFNREDVTRLGEFEVAHQINEFNPDLVIEEEKNDGVSKFTGVYQLVPHVPKAFWLIDAHCNLIDHVVYAKQFDYVFCAQSWFLPILSHEFKGKLFYLPLSHTQTLTELLASPTTNRDIGFSFIGNIRSIHVERKQFVLEFLYKYGDYFIAHQSDYDQMLAYLRRSRLTFNCSLNNDLNFRVWEALACGAVLLTDDVTDLDSIQGLREHVVVYDKLNPNWKHLVTGPDYKDGAEFAKNHTLTHRYNQLIEMVQTGKQYEY